MKYFYLIRTALLYWMITLLFTLLGLWQNSVGYAEPFSQGHPIVLSEIMYDPIGSEYYDEFVEIFNNSEKDTVHLMDWQIGDGVGYDTIVDAGEGLSLAPKQFGIIVDQGYQEHSTTYDSLIPPEALLLTIDGASFGQRGWTNSSAKTIELVNASGEVVEQYQYSIGNQSGYSDEKIDLRKGNTSDNWAESIVINGTPGYRNSVSPKAHDLSLLLSKSPDRSPDIGEIWSLKFQIANKGIRPAANFQLLGYLFSGGDHPDSTLFYDHRFSDTLKSNESLDWEISFQAEAPGMKTYRFCLHWNNEEKPSDNCILYNLYIPFEQNCVVLNEIMYHPAAGQPEWLEIFNRSEYSIDLMNWRFSTEPDFENAVILSNSTDSFAKGDYCVLSGDTLWCASFGENGNYIDDFPALRNKGDHVYLFGPSGKLIDHVVYSPDWGKKRGHSLEKIWAERSGTDSSNWGLSLFKNGTPGKMNSRSPLQKDIALQKVFINPHPIPYHSPASANLQIINAGRTSVNEMTIHIFLDTNNDSMPQPAELLLSEQTIDTLFSKEDTLYCEYGLPNLKSGIVDLSVFVEAAYDQDIDNNFKRIEVKVGYPAKTLVINEVLYQPINNHPEWIELFNCSEKTVNLREWKLMEIESERSYPLTWEDVFLAPDDFCVVASDSGLSLPDEAYLLIPNEFPSLNNTEDNIKLMDFSSTTIDSLSYSSNWGGDAGISIERINPYLNTQDSSNWASCAAAAGMTPGKENSVFVSVLPDNASLSVSPNPFSPDGDGFEDVAIIQYNLPMTTAYVSLNVFDRMGRKVCELLNTAPSGSHGEVIWNGKKNNGESLRIGVYILFLEALNAKLGMLKQLKEVVVLARKL